MANFERSKNPGEPSPAVPEPVQPRKPRVLIVEDDLLSRELLEIRLRDSVELVGVYESATDTETMLEKREKEEPAIDVVITDLGLLDGKEAGWAVAAAAKRRYPNTHVILFTGSAVDIIDDYTPKELKDRGVDEVLGKPLDSLALKKSIEQITHNIYIRERYRAMRRPYLAPIEHLMMASTPDVKGETLDTRGLIGEARSGNREARHVLLTPTFFQQEGREDRSLVVGDRAELRSQRIPKGLPILDPQAVIELATKEKVDVFCELSDLDEEDQVRPKWNVYLTRDDEIIRDPSLTAKLLPRLRLLVKPGDPYSPHTIFGLETSGNEYALLTLRL